MQEGQINEISYYFPADRINKYLDGLPNTDRYDNQYMDIIEDKIVVMTHDDQFDTEMFKIEIDNGYKSTWFILSNKISYDIPKEADIQIHFNKEDNILSGQIEYFDKILGYKPKFNRNHRLLWRSNNFDFPLLALNGILADSTLIGTRPYQPIINGKLIPIWEIPFCITDRTKRFMAIYSLVSDYEILFREGVSPIVVLSHPFDICQRYNLESCFYECIRLTQKYDYKMINMSEFYDRYLKIV